MIEFNGILSEAEIADRLQNWKEYTVVGIFIFLICVFTLVIGTQVVEISKEMIMADGQLVSIEA